MNIYQVTVIQFDSLENRNPRYVEKREFFHTEKSAEKYIKEYKKSNKRHKGWDGEFYPQFKIKKKEIK